MLMPAVEAMCVSAVVFVAQLMKVRKVAAWMLAFWVLRVKECPQRVHRQRVVPLLVVPFFFVFALHAGHCGRLVVTG